MNFRAYLLDKIRGILFLVVGMILLIWYLYEVGNEIGILVIVGVSSLFLFVIYFVYSYWVRKRYIDEVLDCLDQLDQKYLIADVIPKPQRFVDEVYQRIIKAGNKSMLEMITNVKHERHEYKNYIEQWIHEVKTPMAAMKLICENNSSETTKKLLFELERTDRYLEQALFYARSEHVEKDYLVREVDLEHTANRTVIANKYMLIIYNVSITVKCIHKVYTDDKWIAFILEQFIINAVKYEAKNIWIYTEELYGNIHLSVKDDGIGILEEDITRIFQKGFTGKNGHQKEKSTGIGLYLCKRLCDKLGIGISVESEVGEGSFTKLTITFSTGNFMGRSKESYSIVRDL